MVEKLACPSCGANLRVEEGKTRGFCVYCGSEIVYKEASAVATTYKREEIESAAKSAINFNKSLMLEIKGTRFSLAEGWNSLMSDPSMGIDKLTKFYKSNRSQILFCINAYQELPEDIKYEIGDFTCEQIESIIRFREENYFTYIEELDTIEAAKKQCEYDLGAKGFFDFKGKKVLKNKINRINAREVVVLYDYAMLEMNKAVENFNTQTAAIKQELAAAGSMKRKKELKERIMGFEVAKEERLKELQIPLRTKAYNKVVKKYGLKHVDLLAQKEENAAKAQESKEARAKLAEQKPEINYGEFDVKDLLSAFEESLDKLAVGVTRSEIEKFARIAKEINNRMASLPQEAGIYFQSISMMAGQIVDAQQPAARDHMIRTMGSTIKSQLAMAKGKL